MDALDIFPVEIWQTIIYLSQDHITFLNLSLTCKFFSNITLDKKIQRVMKDRFSRKVEIIGKRKIIRYVLPNGTQHGPYVSFHQPCVCPRQKETVFEDGFYKNGLKHGTWTIYNPFGDINEQFNLKKGKRHGKCLSPGYKKNACDQRRSEVQLFGGNYLNGKKDGDWIEMDRIGTKYHTVYKNGRVLKQTPINGNICSIDQLKIPSQQQANLHTKH